LHVREVDQNRWLTIRIATSSGGPLYGMGQTNGGLIFFGGGVPLNVGGQFIGAIGVSGGTVAEDIAVANAGVAALK
jgi:uncharacterized protein GlcG (DUF336 family)